MANELVIRVTAMPTDLNPYGGVFGGWLMSQLALGAGSLASRRGAGQGGGGSCDRLHLSRRHAGW
jgi:acyl-CoA thioesterase YciA